MHNVRITQIGNRMMNSKSINMNKEAQDKLKVKVLMNKTERKGEKQN